MKPRQPQYYIDENYILYVVGLLGQSEPAAARELAVKYLKRVQYMDEKG